MKARFRSDALPALFEVLKKYVQPGKNYVLEISQEVTMKQMAYYRAVIVPLFCQVTGYSKKKAHRLLTEGFLTVERDGKPFTRSTAELTTIEMEAFIEDCRQWLYHEYRVVAPLPGSEYIDAELLADLEKTFLL